VAQWATERPQDFGGNLDSGSRYVSVSVELWLRTVTVRVTVRWGLSNIRRSELTMGQWVMGQMGQIWVGHVGYPWPVGPFYIVLIRYSTWFSGSWKTRSGNRNCYSDYLLVPFHNHCNSVARDEQTTSETHRFPWEGPNSVEILGKKD